MENVFRIFVQNWRFSFLLTALIVVSGVLSLGLLQREAYPPVNFATVVINSVYPGASPEEVQDKVTKIIEDELRGISGVKKVKSVSQSESSEITVEVDIDNKDPRNVVTDIQKAVQRANSKLPTDLLELPRVLEIKAEEIPVYEFALIGPNDQRQRDILAEKIEDEIQDISGVLDVRLSGVAEKELQIQLDPKKLKKYEIGTNEIIQILASKLKNRPSGFIDNKKEISLVRVIGKKNTPEGLKNTVIRSIDSQAILRIKDVGDVAYGTARPKILARIDGQEAALMIVTKKSEADAVSVVEKIEAKVAEFKKNLSTDFMLVVYNDEGSRIQNRLKIVNFNAVSGILIVLLVLFIFLPGKVGLFSSLSLPICALGTVTFMIMGGAAFNIITMIAIVICLGNLVDNSVVISEYYTRLRATGFNGQEAAIKAARQFWTPFLASTITIISAFIPMFVTQGVMGQFIQWIPIIVTIALLLSLLESVTLLPARLQFIHPKLNESESNWFNRFEGLFERLIEKTLKVRFFTVITLVVLVISGFFATAFFNRFELFPAEGVEYYVGRLELDPQTSIFEADRVIKEIADKTISSLDKEDLSSVVTRVGASQTDSSDAKSKIGENVGIIIIGIKTERAPDVDIQKTLTTLRSMMPKTQNIRSLTFETLENGPPVGKPLTVTVRSSDPKQLREFTAELFEFTQKIEGVENLGTDELETGFEYRFLPNDERTTRAFLNTDVIGTSFLTALNGTPVGELSENGRKFDVIVRFKHSETDDIGTLTSSQILNSQNNYVQVSKIGTFDRDKSPRIIRSFDYKRAITLSSDVNTEVISSLELNKLVRGRALELEKKYNEINLVFGGEEESTNESLQSLLLALIIAIFCIFATLVLTFDSFKKSLVILSTIPLGLVGVLYAFVLTQRPLSFLAFIGVVGLSGVVINSAIILIDYIEELKLSHPNLTIDEVLVKASKERLRAVLATGLTTVVGLLPTAFGLGGYDSILVPITLALSWGMIIGTVLTLIWIPSIYSILNWKKQTKDII
ncbi:MAG: efflux RND transporter permease subunit [Pseudobdellovibrionaceae bacterium]